MVLRLSSPSARLLLVLVALALAAALSYSSIRNAIAVRAAERNTRAGYERATQLEPDNALNWYLLGRYWQYNLEEPDAHRAIAAYRTSLSRNARSADAWLDLAEAYESEGDLGAARDAFLQAKHVYSLSAEVSWRYGNFLLRQNELVPAFAQIRHAVAVDPKRAASAFTRCWRVDPDIQAILENALPPDSSAYLAAIRELEADAQVGPALTVWARLAEIHPSIKLSDAIPLVDMLVLARRLDDARRVWDQAAALSGTAQPADPPGSLLWDGGFETGASGGGFAWLFGRLPGGMQAGLDLAEKHSGRQSLRLNFDGEHNVDFSDICHLAAVQPAASYRLSAWVHTQGLTSHQGIRLRLTWQEPQTGFVQTDEVHGNQPWTKLELSWTAPAGVDQVHVCIARSPGDEYGSRIQGTAWVDDVVLVPEAPAVPEQVNP
jgi:hypothetical protein